MGGAPIDYWSQLTAPDPGAVLQKSFAAAQAGQLQRAQQERALQQQAQLDEARAKAIADPTAANFNRLFLLDPANREAIKAGHDAMDADQQKTTLEELSAIRGLVKAGRGDQAAARLQRRIDADKAAGQDVADDEEMLSLIADDPEAAAGALDYMLAGIMGPEKWEATFKAVGDDRRADETQPSLIAKNVADVASTNATAAKTNAEAAQVAPLAAAEIDLKAAQRDNFLSAVEDRAARLELDRDTLETNTSLELEKLLGKGQPLSASSETAMTNAVISAEGARQLATRANGLADRIETAPIGFGGVFATLKEAGAGAFGKQDAVSALRKEYQTLIVSQAVANLPPGPASDKDIKLAMSGFPKSNANAATMASFLRGMGKLQTIRANRDQARADWISENGNLGRARRDITVNGVRVPAGSTFGDFSNSQASSERREAVPERSYMRFGSGQ